MNRFSGRDFTDEELTLIREMISNNPQYSRTKLSQLVCEKLGWYKFDGKVKEMSCRVAMLRMQDSGLITLPTTKRKIKKNKIESTLRTDQGAVIEKAIHDLSPITLELVDKKTTGIWNEYIHRYHYLGYTPLPGAQLRYIVRCDDQIISLLGFGASAWMCKPRDEYIGWSHSMREENLNLVINNNRFLILPWVKSKNLASSILSKIAKRITFDWQQKYNYRPVLIETFVDTEKFNGGCYKASNWKNLGETKGRGKLGVAGKKSTSIKSIWIFPLSKTHKKTLTTNQNQPNTLKPLKLH